MIFIQGHALVHFSSPVDAYSDGLHIYLALVIAAILGVVRQGGFSPRNFYRRLLVRLASDHWYISFTNVHSPTPWSFSLSGFLDVSDMNTLLRDPLSRVLLMVQYLQLFWRGFRNGLVNLQSFPHNMACLIHQSSWRYFLLSPGCWFSDRFCLEVLADFCSYLSFIFLGGYPKFLDVILCKCE